MCMSFLHNSAYPTRPSQQPILAILLPAHNQNAPKKAQSQPDSDLVPKSRCRCSNDMLLMFLQHFNPINTQSFGRKEMADRVPARFAKYPCKGTCARRSLARYASNPIVRFGRNNMKRPFCEKQDGGASQHMWEPSSNVKKNEIIRHARTYLVLLLLVNVK